MSPELTKHGRLLSLDVYRGLTMLLMCSSGLGLGVLENTPGWSWLARQVDHVAWKGCVLWDLIQPSFMFIVGVAMPLAFAIRSARGQSRAQQFKHVVKRSLSLLIIGVALICVSRGKYVIDLTTVLQQIAIGYFFAFFVLGRGFRVQTITVFLILAVHWALFQFWPGVGPDGPWAKNANFASWLDYLWLNRYDPGGYTSFNAFSSTATIIFGVMAGELLRKEITEKRKVVYLALAGVCFLILGTLLHPLIPVVKRIWTASWAIYSTGWALLLLAFFYWVIEVAGRRKWCFIFMVVGMNSIFIYVFNWLMRGSLNEWIWAFTRPVLDPLGAPGTIIQSVLLLAALWYSVYWLYKREIFLKVG
ncbi:MAG TPA: DUF5009 domain-containing protein [archaeon]|nr:DUF5009 domain-containing protein [archaeon]